MHWFSAHPARRTRPLAALSLVTLLMLGACAQIPSVATDYVAPVITVPAAWLRASDTPTSTPASALPDLAGWWQRLNDPQLDALVGQALAASPDLHSAQARLRQSRASRELASAGQWPIVGASGSRTRSQASAATSGGDQRQTLYAAGFDASWEPDWFGGIRRGIEAAEADTQAAEATLRDTQVSLVAEVARNYIELRSAQQRIAIARDNLASQDETLEITHWRTQAGLATQLDVAQATTAREQTRAALPALESTQATAEHRLAVLGGQTPDALHQRLASVQRLPTPPTQIAVGIPADTLRQRPDVRAAERTLAGETARIGAQTAARYPDFSLSGSFGWQALSLSGLGSAAAVTRSLAGSLAVSLFDGGHIASRIAVQEAVQEQALAAYEKTVLTALEDIENALAAYAAVRERETAQRAAAISAHSATVLARQLYQSGLADFQKVLDTERTRLSAEDGLATAQADILNAVIQLYKALGGGWTNSESTT